MTRSSTQTRRNLVVEEATSPPPLSQGQRPHHYPAQPEGLGIRKRDDPEGPKARTATSTDKSQEGCTTMPGRPGLAALGPAYKSNHLRNAFLLLAFLTITNTAFAQKPASSQTSPHNHHLNFFKTLVRDFPTTLNEPLITHAYREQLATTNDPTRLSTAELLEHRKTLLDDLGRTLPTITINADDSVLTIDSHRPLTLCRGLASPLLANIHNTTTLPLSLQIKSAELLQADSEQTINIPPGETIPLLFRSRATDASKPVRSVKLPIVATIDHRKLTVPSFPIQFVAPAFMEGIILNENTPCPGRVTIECSDGICRHGDGYGRNPSFTNKPIIYPPIGGSRKLPFFYSDGSFRIAVPPGPTKITLERGFEHERSTIEVKARESQTSTVELKTETLVDMQQRGWVSGDTHVHWVTNAWNIDEPLEALADLQRAEGLQVANNLTLLQRNGNQAFIKPSQAPMGPITAFSDNHYHIHMGEEYRNEDLYGHLCFLNIDWLVQPIGTGSVIAGPDALDYPINRTAIHAARQQGGISIEAHGTGGNKDVPVNVIHNLSDSLDQIEPEIYYRFLDCGFQLPLTNGSDYPARPLGIARAYVKTDGDFTYQKWIEGIRNGRTFTTSGPLIFLTVNDAQIGDTLHGGSETKLTIKANVVSRDPIGTFQIVSNRKVIAETTTDETTAELEVTMAASESRWIVARCSNRSDGRSDFEFGNFNVITGPGVAHTSPVYVQVDGQPRFSAAAAAYWADRLRLHALDIESCGRFANTEQRSEAASYVNQGIRMFGDLEKQTQAARSRSETVRQMTARLTNVLRRFGHMLPKDTVESLANVETITGLSSALTPWTLLKASVNPESRVKIHATRDRIEVRQHRPQRFLVELENTAGITAPLEIEAYDISASPPSIADWCEVRTIDSPFTSVFLTGNGSEYKVIEVTVKQPGLKEVRLIANVGQGTQDLGFRATADLMINALPKKNVLP